MVADTPEHAQRAANGVKITYEDLPAIITIEVMENGAAPVEESALILLSLPLKDLAETEHSI